MERISISLSVRDKSQVKDDAVSSAMEQAMKPRLFQTKLTSEITTVIKPLAGESASGWDTVMTESLYCVALRSVHMQAIIPDFHTRVQELFNTVGSCKVARFMFESIGKPDRSDLTEFSSATHISQYLFNPWLPIFLALRDLLSLGETRTITINTDGSQPLPFDSSLDRERKLENMSEQLLHRFMEVTLLLFSIICNGRDEFRSTPSRTGGFSQVGLCKCEILDDGYIYVARQTSNGAGNQYGRTPVIRFERKEKSDTGSAMPQIFSELLSAAALNRKYDNAGHQTGVRMGANEDRSDYHDAFVIQMRHCTLTVHTVRFPLEYLRWVTGDNVNADSYKASKDGYAIIHKESKGYDLSEQDGRREALKNILTLLWAIQFPGTSTLGIHVARVLAKKVPAL